MLVARSRSWRATPASTGASAPPPAPAIGKPTAGNDPVAASTAVVRRRVSGPPGTGVRAGTPISTHSVDAGGSPEEHERAEFVDGYLRRVTGGNMRLPILVFPTGNHPHEVDHECDLGVPARSEATVAIGAIESTGAQAVGSRYGPKLGADPNRWWVAPGGSFGGSRTDPRTAVRTWADKTSIRNYQAGTHGKRLICITTARACSRNVSSSCESWSA